MDSRGAQRIQRAGFDQAFKYALIQEARLDALAKIIQVT